jgi:putative PEP-CTERM system TPR-repeat lipoprotein
MRSGRTQEAIRIASALQRDNARSALGWLLEGDAHMQEKRFASAAKAYERAHQVQPSGTALIKLHAAFAGDGKPLEGENRLLQWVKAQPADTGTRLYLAEAYLKSERWQSAIVQYESLLKDAPGQIVALNNLAWCYLQVKDKRAVEIAQQAVKLDPKNPALLDTLGWILVQNGDSKGGLEHLKTAAELAPKNPEIRVHYAQALVQAGQRNQGKDELERLLLAFPRFAEAQPALALLNELRRQ